MSKKISKCLGNIREMTLKKRWVFSRRWNMNNDSADGKSFQISWLTTGIAWLATVDSLTGGTTRRLVPAEQSD